MEQSESNYPIRKWSEAIGKNGEHPAGISRTIQQRFGSLPLRQTLGDSRKTAHSGDTLRSRNPFAVAIYRIAEIFEHAAKDSLREITRTR